MKKIITAIINKMKCLSGNHQYYKTLSPDGGFSWCNKCMRCGDYSQVKNIPDPLDYITGKVQP